MRGMSGLHQPADPAADGSGVGGAPDRSGGVCRRPKGPRSAAIRLPPPLPPDRENALVTNDNDDTVSVVVQRSTHLVPGEATFSGRR